MMIAENGKRIAMSADVDRVLRLAEFVLKRASTHDGECPCLACLEGLTNSAAQVAQMLISRESAR
jgi:hypothetical protein